MAHERLHSTNRAGDHWEATWTQYRHLTRDEAGQPIGEGEYRREAEGEFILPEHRHGLVGREVEIGEYVPELAGRVLITDADPLPPRPDKAQEERYCYRFLGQETIRFHGRDPLDEAR